MKQAKCPRCRKVLHLPSEMKEQRFRCDSCGQVLRVREGTGRASTSLGAPEEGHRGKRWQAIINGQTRGAFTTGELVGLVDSGIVASETAVWEAEHPSHVLHAAGIPELEDAFRRKSSARTAGEHSFSSQEPGITQRGTRAQAARLGLNAVEEQISETLDGSNPYRRDVGIPLPRAANLEKCGECGSQVSNKATACPHCGAPAPRKPQEFSAGSGILIALLVVGLVVALWWPFGSPEPHSTPRQEHAGRSGDAPSASSAHRPPSPPRAVHRMDETVTIGYTSYWIWNARWSNRLGEGPLLDSKPDAYFLIVEMSVRNNDKENRSIPPFTLLDEKGAVYSASGKGWALEGSIGVLDDLNPGVRKRGTVVFDVPKAHRYRLRVSGGYWSGEEALIDIVPN